MATSIFELFGTIMVDNRQADESLTKTEKKAGSLAESLGKGVKSAAKFGAAVGTAAVAAGAGIVKLASNTADTADVIDKASQRMQISAESYQEFAHAAELSGVEMSTLEKAAKKLDGSMTFDQAMNEIYSLETAEERAAKAAELFGDSVAYNMTPMLNASAEDMAAMKQEAHDLGLVLSEDDVKAGAELNDTLTKLKKGFGAMITQLGAKLMPVVQRVGDALLKFLPKIIEMFDKFAPMLLDLAEQLVPFLLQLAEALLPTIFSLLDTLMPTVQMIAQSVLPIIVSCLNMINPLLQTLNKILEPILKVVNAILQPLLELVNFIIGGISDGISGLLGVLGGEDGILGVVGKVGDLFSSVFGGIKDLLTNPLQAIKDFFNGVWEVCEKIMGWIWDKVSGVFQDIYDFLDWINPFSDSADERHAKATKDMSMSTALDTFAPGLSKLVPTDVNNNMNISGTVRLEGVNNQGEFVGAAEYTADQLTKKLTQDARLGYGY